MNPTTYSGVKALVDDLAAADIDPKAEIVVAPPTLYLIPAAAHLATLKPSFTFNISAQNVYSKTNGAFTGEISPEMLVDAGIKYTLTGHSERRTLFKDTSDTVAARTKAALDAGIKVIFCIGETLDEREGDKTMSVCEEMIKAVVNVISEKDWANVVIAYEPVWAIGTGKVATSAQAQDVHHQIRAYLSANVSQNVAEATRIIYGGSVTAANCKELATCPDIDGFLVGGASLKPEFVQIGNARRA